jgi:hypothetical protein
MALTFSPAIVAAAIAIAVGSRVRIVELTAQSPVREVRVEAGAHDRRDVVVSFAAPGLQPDAQYVLRGETTTLQLQADRNGRAWFVLPELTAGAAKTFRLEQWGLGVQRAIQASEGPASVDFSWNGKPILQYVIGPGTVPSPDVKPIFARGGYLHPVRTPSGRVVTDDYPADHRHHHGVWFAWTKTHFQGRDPDFWNVGDGKARVEFEALEHVWSGPVQSGLRARHRYVDLTSGSPIAVLSEQWDTRVFAVDGQRYLMFDVDVRQSNVSSDPLELPEYHYGGIGVRGAASFVTLDNVQFLTSEGKDRATGDGTESRWAVISGGVDGARASIAILAHPGNFRAPERMRIHPTDPYLCYAPSRSGPWAITKGAVHDARYRFVTFDGAPDPADLQRLWRDYAHPPLATIR